MYFIKDTFSLFRDNRNLRFCAVASVAALFYFEKEKLNKKLPCNAQYDGLQPASQVSREMAFSQENDGGIVTHLANSFAVYFSISQSLSQLSLTAPTTLGSRDIDRTSATILKVIDIFSLLW